eukprot:g4481.t1
MKNCIARTFTLAGLFALSSVILDTTKAQSAKFKDGVHVINFTMSRLAGVRERGGGVTVSLDRGSGKDMRVISTTDCPLQKQNDWGATISINAAKESLREKLPQGAQSIMNASSTFVTCNAWENTNSSCSLRIPDENWHATPKYPEFVETCTKAGGQMCSTVMMVVFGEMSAQLENHAKLCFSAACKDSRKIQNQLALSMCESLNGYSFAEVFMGMALSMAAVIFFIGITAAGVGFFCIQRKSCSDICKSKTT